MIEYIKGIVAGISPTTVIIEAAGIGYELNISLTTFSVIERQPEAKLLVHEVIREDTHILYGFVTTDEREIFRLLIGVSGIGANTARMILSAIPPQELSGIITSGDHTRLKSVKGIGTKTAQRIIVDLRDKIKPTDNTFTQQPALYGEVFDESLAALVMLGFPKTTSDKVLRKIFEANPAIKVEDAIKRALSML